MIALLALLNGIAKSARNGKALSWPTKTQSKKAFLCDLCVLRGKKIVLCLDAFGRFYSASKVT